MGLYRRLDWWAIADMVDEITEGSGHKDFRNSEYVGYYDELLTEIANAAGDLWCDIDRIKREIYNHEIPWKKRKYAEEDEETENAA